MPIYEFSCPECGTSYERLSRLNPGTCVCGANLKRRYSFAFHAPIPGHFNHSVGRYVSNDREFRDALKIKSEENSLATGIDHNYVYVDPADTKSLGVTDEGLDETRKRAYDAS